MHFLDLKRMLLILLELGAEAFGLVADEFGRELHLGRFAAHLLAAVLAARAGLGGEGLVRPLGVT